MNSSLVKHEKFDHLHLFYHLTIPLSKTASSNVLFTIILGDFNTRFSSRWKEGKTPAEGTHLEALTFLHNFNQLISEPIHIVSHFSSCIDLIINHIHKKDTRETINNYRPVPLLPIFGKLFE